MLFSEILSVFANIPTLSTERLVLRKIKPCDAEDMFEYASDHTVTRYLTWYPHENLKHTKKYISYLQMMYRNGEFYDWGIIYKGDEKMIGTCGFSYIDSQNNSAEVGYVLNPKYWGKGIAAEALREVIRFGFGELGFERLEAKHIEGNVNSSKVMKKCGMSFEGIMRNSMIIKGEYKTLHRYAILRSDPLP